MSTLIAIDWIGCAGCGGVRIDLYEGAALQDDEPSG
jgi:hypothetical protein